MAPPGSGSIFSRPADILSTASTNIVKFSHWVPGPPGGQLACIFHSKSAAWTVVAAPARKASAATGRNTGFIPDPPVVARAWRLNLPHAEVLTSGKWIVSPGASQAVGQLGRNSVVARAEANGIEIEYELRGPAGGEPILMIGGLGMQLISWPDALIDGLGEAGFRPILFDNRDCGLSTRFEEAGLANIGRAFKQARAGEPVDAPYTIEDMADDGAGLLDALGIEAAHIYGSSNGGAIAQLVAIRHPAKTKSLASVMATSGRRGLPRPSQAASEWLNAPRPADIDRGTFMELAWEQNRIMGSPGFPRDEACVRARAGAPPPPPHSPPRPGRPQRAAHA
ncbi:MAG: alpha/beta fold hydrolase [Alphaproteobacteria bacterium]|nr:alpha/beta fold hydrolase [Alphaproteobacteria bacterium]